MDGWIVRHSCQFPVWTHTVCVQVVVCGSRTHSNKAEIWVGWAEPSMGRTNMTHPCHVPYQPSAELIILHFLLQVRSRTRVNGR